MQPLDISVDVMIQEPAWHSVLENPEAFCKTVVSNICDAYDVSKQGELSIALVSDTEIQHLNKTYRGKDTPTNVLSFPDGGPAPILGDIVIAYDTVSRETLHEQKEFSHHLIHLLVHGFLHLQGYDHETDSEAAIMEALEIKILAKMNIDNPYIIKEPVAP